MPKIINFDSKDELSISDFTSVIDSVTGLTVTTGIYRSVADWQIEKHLPMFDADMTTAQKAKAAAIIAKVKAK